MRPPRPALVSAAAACVVAAATVAGTAGSAHADVVVPVPSVSPLPSVSVPPLPVPVPTLSNPVPVPSVSVPGAGTLPGTGGQPLTGGGSRSGSGSGGAAASSTSGGTAAGAGTSAAGARQAAPGTAAARRLAAKRKADATPMIAGTAAAKDLVDDESSPQLYRASQQFLAADQGIAEIDRQKQLMAQLKAQAVTTAQLYRSMGYDVAGAQRIAAAWHQQYDALTAGTSAADRRRIEDTTTRADERVGDLVVAREHVKSDFEALAARYHEAKVALADANSRIEQYAAARTTALGAVQAARGSDVALNQARVAESGQLGAEIQSLSAELQKRGQTVDGSGTFARPLDGTITSPFGMRMHPILHYVKLHTGTDFAGSSVIHAADDGRVIMTLVSTAYGNFTVIDHGMVNGKHLTTAYAHQSRFLVRVGQVVHKGEPIGIVGATGFATGPHLHFEVRLDGTVVDPMTFLR